MKVLDSLQEVYQNQYDEDIVKWRTLGAKFKAKNIIDLAKNIEFKSVLEVGCGEGSILSRLSELNFCENLFGLEISESAIKLVKEKNIKNLNSISIFDGYNLPFEDNEIDLIICSHVLEHVEFERTLLREIKRVSKYQIFEVPIDFSFYVDKKLNHFLSYGHINIYTPSLFRFLIKSEGFQVVNDLPSLFDKELLRFMYSKESKAFYINRFKRFILNNFSYLKGIKPDSYAVLTKKGEGGLQIF